MNIMFTWTHPIKQWLYDFYCINLTENYL